MGGPDIRRPHKIPVDCSPFAADKTPFVVACFFAKIAANGSLICFEAAASGDIQQDCRTYPPFIGADWRALDWHPHAIIVGGRTARQSSRDSAGLRHSFQVGRIVYSVGIARFLQSYSGSQFFCNNCGKTGA